MILILKIKELNIISKIIESIFIRNIVVSFILSRFNIHQCENIIKCDNQYNHYFIVGYIIADITNKYISGGEREREQKHKVLSFV